MLLLCTDFGFNGPYIGQMKSVAANTANCTVIDLIHDLPRFNPRAASYLLAALVKQMPEDCVIVAVVDPGVGSDREALALWADKRWIVGPDNGLLDIISRQASQSCFYKIIYRPENMSNSFHGRDLFMPVALKIHSQQKIDEFLLAIDTPNLQGVANEIAEIIYIDDFGNLMTGLIAELHAGCQTISFKGMDIMRMITFSDAAQGQPLFYANSQGLLEIAVNRGNAQQYFAAQIGDCVLL